ncbi:MAG TPA: S24 family peptidase [Thermoanaerobaculia bacterium]
MAIEPNRGGSIRDIASLARRVYDRWVEYRRRHHGMSVPVDHTLSRLFEHVPEYRPHRPRGAERQDRAAKIPGVFKLQQVADALETTVGDLLGEPGYERPRELLTPAQRRTLRDATRILTELFDLDDDALEAEPPPFSDEARVPVAPEEFVARDYDYPRIWDERLQVVRVLGDSMAPELRHGWKVLVDTGRTYPADDALVAVYKKHEGGVLGRWHREGAEVFLRKANIAHPAVRLGHPDEWIVLGTVTKIVEAPIEPGGR